MDASVMSAWFLFASAFNNDKKNTYQEDHKTNEKYNQANIGCQYFEIQFSRFQVIPHIYAVINGIFTCVQIFGWPGKMKIFCSPFQ